MRCPNCGGLNPDNIRYCMRCGRELTPAQPSQQQPAYPPPTKPGPTVPQRTPTYQPPQPVQRPTPVTKPTSVTVQQAPTVQRANYPPAANPLPQQVPAERRSNRQRPLAVPVEPVEPPAPEPPAPFPPRTIGQLKALEPGAQPYTFVTDATSYGKKQIIRISYRRCAAWQQAATLLKAFREYDTAKYDTILIQGEREQEDSPYAYTNGQLTFDRNTRLGSQTLDRYQIETGNGFASDSIRIVLTE